MFSRIHTCYRGKQRSINSRTLNISAGSRTRQHLETLVQMIRQKSGSEVMVAGAIVAVFVIFGLFLSMLGSSPKSDEECQIDTEA